MGLTRAIKTKLFGSEKDFSMANRMFNMAMVAIIIVLVIYLFINAIMGLWQRSLIVVFVFVAECIFYYYSRFRKKFQVSIIANGFVSYIALVANYFINSGVDGPTIFLFFFSLHILVSGTPPKWHIPWLALHIVIVTGLLVTQYYVPGRVVYNYPSPAARFIDVFATYISTLLLMFIVTRHLRNYYLNEKYATEDEQIKLTAFFESSPNYHLLLNRQMELIYFNKTAAQFVKAEYNIDLKEGDNLFSYANPAYSKRFSDNIEKALEGQTVLEEAFFNYTVNGKVWWQMAYIPARDREGNIVAVSFNAVNINDRKAKEEKISQKNQSLLKIAKIQSGGLREPVSSIIGLMSLIKEDKERTPEYLQLMEEAAKELDKKIHEIVEQTRGASVDD